MATRKAAQWRDALDDPGMHLARLSGSDDIRSRLEAIFAVATHPDLSNFDRSMVRIACREAAIDLARLGGSIDIGGVVYKVGPGGGLQCCLPWD